MALLRIDVQTTAGVQLGYGPITSASNWKMTNRLGRAGEFTFQMSLADPQYPYLANRVLVRAWQLIDGTMTQLGVGIVDSVVEDSNANPSTATVSGANLMRELTWRSVKGLLISEPGYVSPDDVHKITLDSSGSGAEASPNNYIQMTATFDGNAATNYDLNHAADAFQYVYIGFSRAFKEVKFHFNQVNQTVVATTNVVQYFNGTAWVSLTYTDGTAVAGICWKQNGSWTFTVPTDWVPLVQNCIATGATPDNNLNDYWLRVHMAGWAWDHVKIDEITVLTDVATLTGAQLIMALAPAGWTLTGYTTTLTAAYLQLGDETILEALTNLATLVGEQFRLTGTGTAREIGWIRTDQTDSGVIAMRNGDPTSILADPTRCLISELHTTKDSYNLVSRVIPYGAGSGSARLTLASTTRTAPAGYTLSAASNYLKFDATEVTYGQVEKVQVWSNIGPATSASADQVAAANSLYDAALYWLSINALVLNTYALVVYALTTALRPGDTLHIVWLEVVDGVAIRNVDANLIILEAATTVDEHGTYAVALTVSNQPFFPPTEDDVLAKLGGALKHISAFTQPTALTSLVSATAAITVTPTRTGFGGLNYS